MFLLYTLFQPSLDFSRAGLIDGAKRHEVNFNFKKADTTKFMDEKLSPVHNGGHLKRSVSEIIV